MAYNKLVNYDVRLMVAQTQLLSTALIEYRSISSQYFARKYVIGIMSLEIPINY